MTDEWYEHAYPGGAMVPVKGFPRPLYPPDALERGEQPSIHGPDVEGYKRTIARAGRWPWQENFDSAYSNAFSHGRGGMVGTSGVAGVQRQQGLEETGWLGRKTFDTLRSIVVPEGLPHAGERAMDTYAMSLINQAWILFGGEEPPISGNPRQLALDHLEKRVGYTEDPWGSNCDRRPDGIRTAQDHTAGSGTWLRGQPWCGCWCYYALETAQVRAIDYSLASVAQIENYARQAKKCFRGWTVDRNRVQPGDLVVIGDRKSVV